MGRSGSATKHEAILDAALAVFLEKGYLGTSMDQIAARAGVSKQTVYKHFADKNRLFAEILLATTGEVDRLVRWIVDEFDDPRKLEQTFDRLARHFLGALMEPHLLRLRRLVIANADRFPELGRSWYEAGFERVLTTLADSFGRLADAGRLKIDDPLVAANHFVGMLLWIPVNKAMFTGSDKPFTDIELDRLARASARTFLHAHR
ncbi:MAG TPA: TetR/AcrR family transcriptional regulator [Candidatus Baltobacteraceae bacterium]|nr:TetR/AcrR family transcriptional regulator [Candidatus Baltobacteraceae bacterium]